MIEVSSVLRLDGESINKLVDIVLGLGGLLVTRPSIVAVSSSRGPLLVSLGVGSLVLPGDPGIDGLRVYRLARPEWVEGCYIGSSDPVYSKPGRPDGYIDGVIVSLDPLDPAAALINGLRGPMPVGEVEDRVRGEKLAMVNGAPVLYYYLHGYATRIAGGEAGKRLDYIAPLASSCNKAMKQATLLRS